MTMYGKFFASTFTGSMYGAGPEVFAVWGYVIANAVDSQVELNPLMLAATIGTTPERIAEAIEVLCAPDPRSRSKGNEGRRLIREGEYAYHVPNFLAYRSIRNEEDRRAYNREKQREHRERVKHSVNDSQSLSTLSAQAEAETVSRDKRQRKKQEGNGTHPKASPETTALLAIAELREAVWTAGYDGTRKINWDKVGEHHREKVRAAFLASGWTLEEFDAGKDFGNSKKFCAVYSAQ